MKKTDALVRLLDPYIRNKRILEVACGAADFSVSALRAAKRVACIDLDDGRLSPLANREAIHFQVMDASRMTYPDQAFDTVVLYNAFFHIQSQWNAIKKECLRVVQENGAVLIIGTWKMDTHLMKDTFGEEAKWQDGFFIAELKKTVHPKA